MLERRVAAVAAEVPGLRHAAVDFARRVGATPDVCHTIALAVSEAVTNAVVHAFVGREPGTVTLAGEAVRGAVVLIVCDDGRGLRPRHDSPGLGLGLPTIGRVVRQLDIGSGPGGQGTEVRMEFAAPGVAPSDLDAERTRARRRVEGALGVLTQAVTVTDAEGRIVFANDAAARLLGAADADELLAAGPGEVAARFDVSLEDGAPLTLERLPGRQVLTGIEPEPLLVRARERATGLERWTLTTSSLLEGPEPLAVNVIQDVTALRSDTP